MEISLNQIQNGQEQNQNPQNSEFFLNLQNESESSRLQVETKLMEYYKGRAEYAQASLTLARLKRGDPNNMKSFAESAYKTHASRVKSLIGTLLSEPFVRNDEN